MKTAWQKMPLKEAKQLYKDSKEAYYNGTTSILSDADFDSLEDHIRTQSPNWPELRKTGVRVANKKQEVKHTHFMPSLAKKYPEKIDAWLKKYVARASSIITHVLIMAKIDGTSLQVTYEGGRPVRLVTRGDGILGQDISYLIPFVNLPQKIKHRDALVLRLEAVMPSSVFEAKWKHDGKSKRTKDEFNDPRGMVNGLFNRQLDSLVHPAFKDIVLYVLGVYDRKMSEGLTFANSQGFKVVPNKCIERSAAKLNAKGLALSETLETYKKSDLFDVDGLVLCAADSRFVLKDAKRPTWMAAYKENSIEGAVKVTVTKMIYQIAGSNRINPKACFEPTKIGGVMVQHATVHNAEWMIERGIGVGAEIMVLRSGDVIPKIVDVVKKAKTLSYPKVPYELRGKFFYALENTTEAAIERIQKFFVAVGVEGMKSKSIATMYEQGYVNYFKYIEAWVSRQGLKRNLLAAGFGTAASANLQAEFDRVFQKGVTIAQLMVGSSKFPNVGMERLVKFETHHKKLTDPLLTFITANESDARAMFNDVPGFKDKSIDLFMENRTVFAKVLKLLGQHLKILAPMNEVKPRAVGPLSGQRVSFTSYRDKQHEARVQSLGGEIVSYGAKTTVLLYKEGGKKSSKVQAADDKGIRVCTFDELMKEHK